MTASTKIAWTRWLRLRTIPALILAAALALFGVATVLAVHDLGLFELDRNATDEAGAGDDWGTLYTGGGSAAHFTGILSDTAAPGTQFHAGGSKDNNDITQWLWVDGEPLDKDDITNAYAAAYVNTVDTGDNDIGDLIIYYGLDRFANNGSAQVGFWFFQNAIGLTNVPQSGGFKFSGVHAVGDLLVQSNFTQGGVIDRISVFKWVGSGGSHGALDLVFTAQDCLDADPVTPGDQPLPGDDPACATVNRADTSAPWPFTPKFGTPGTFPQGSFFEGGLNITRLVPDAGCFTSILAETRTATPFDARLKDFVLGSFDLCAIDVDKTGDTLSKVGDTADYTITISNTGALTLYKDDITDTLLGDITLNGVDQANPYVVSITCGASLAPGASCTVMLSRTVLAGDPDPLPNEVTVVYKGKADLSGTAISDTDDHSVNLFQPSVTIDKTGDELSKVGDSVDYTITVTNTSSADTPNLTCDVTDTLLGLLADDVNLAPGGQHVINTSRMVEEGDPDPLDNTATVTCTVDGFGNVLEASDSHSVNLFQPSVTIDKTGDELSKVGDSVDYTITVNNTSSDDSPNLTCDVSDTLLGLLADDISLAPGDQHVINTSRTVEEGDPDPLDNTATVTCTVDGFGNVLTASDSHSVELFQPSVAIDKTGDTLSKVGDSVDYTITVDNTSSADSPNLTCDVSDTLLGLLADDISLAPGDQHVINTSRTVEEGDPDPLVNTATVTCTVDGFGNVLEASDDHSVELFQPSVTIDKTGDTLSKVGDEVNYTITVNNTSSADSPNLSCTIIDALLGINKNVNLAPGGSDVTNASRTVEEGDPDPLVNTATVNCTVDGFGNVLEASDSHEVDLVHPSLAVSKDCTPTTAQPGDTITYTCTISNTGDVTLIKVSIIDSLVGDLTDGTNPAITSNTCGGSGASLAAGASCTIVYTFIVPSGTATLINTVTATYQVQGLPNQLTESSSCTVTIPTEGCTPGFWKNHTSLWDEMTDPVAAAAGFTTGTSFNAFFGLTPAQSGFPDSLTMEDALNLGGGGGAKLARHGVAALLNLAAGLNYPLPPGINDATDLYNAIRNAYLTGVFEPLAQQLADANELFCPLN